MSESKKQTTPAHEKKERKKERKKESGLNQSAVVRSVGLTVESEKDTTLSFSFFPILAMATNKQQTNPSLT